MAELNFGLLTPPGSQSIGNAFVSGIDQARAAQMQDAQMQQSMRQGQMAELQFKKAQDAEAKLNQFYAHIAENGGPSNPLEIENKMIGSGIPQVANTGLAARMTRLALEQERKRDYEAMFGAQSPDASSSTAAPMPLPNAGPTTAAPMPLPNAGDAQGNAFAPPATAPVNAMAPMAQPSVNNLDRERSARLKLLSKNPGVVAAGRLELQQIMTPHTQTVDGQVLERNPDGTYRVVFGEPTASPITKMQRELAKLPPNDPKRPALEAEINKAKVAQEQGAERVKQGWGQLNVAQRNAVTNEARLELQKNAPKLGLVDSEDIDRVAVAVASGKIPVDRLNSTTAPLFAKLLKAQPNLDLTNLNIEQTGAKTGYTTSARIAARQALTDVDATRAENIAKGNLPPATGLNADKIMNAVIAINPEYNARDYGLQTTAEKSFNTGKQGDKTRSLNVAVSHLGTLDTAATALHAGDIRAFNQFSQAWQRETGKPAPTNFNAVKELVADEIVAAVVPGVGSLADRKALKDSIMAKSSPAQLQGVIKQYKELLGGQLGGLEQQYAATTRKTDFKQRYLTPEATAALRPPAGAASTATSPPPAGVDAALWNVMTPDERKLWQK